MISERKLIAMDRTLEELLITEDAAAGHIFPFLWLHGESEEVLRRYMEVIRNAHMDAVCVESRPHPDFLGEQWWHDMDIILDEARKRDMKVWILDDSHFPTGYANGALQDADAQLCRQSLVYQVMGTVAEGESLELVLEDCARVPGWQPNLMEQYTMGSAGMRQFDDDRLVGIAAVKLGGKDEGDILELTGKVQAGKYRFTAPAGKWRVYSLNLTRNRGPHRTYINMMSRESCKVLLDTIYEAHWQHYGEDFGRTIAGFFSDEPEIGNGHLYESGKRIWEVEDQAWSGEVERELRKEFGEHFVQLLPLLWEKEFDGGKTAGVRKRYMDAITSAVKRDFSEQIGRWCHDHGVEYIGHLIEDNNQHLRCGSSLGHYFRGLSGQDMAGIDCIGGQVLPQGEWDGAYGLMGEHRSGLFYHYVLGKLGSSLAALDPGKRGRCMCEIFGNYGWEEGVRLEKYLADHFLVRGANYFVPHAFSPKEYPDRDCPPHFYANGHNPQYRHFGALMNYMNRVSRLFSGGRHDAPVAILYTAEADWMGEAMALETVAQPLADAQIDYDFVPMDAFCERKNWNMRMDDGLRIHGQHYQVLLIPGCEYLPDTMVKLIPKLEECGCRVFFVEKQPVCIGEGDVKTDCRQILLLEVSELAQQMEACGVRRIRLTPDNNRIRCMRYLAESQRYLFVNEGSKIFKGTILVPSVGNCFAYNAWENRLETVKSHPEGENTLLDVEIYPGKSLVVVFGETEISLSHPVEAKGEACDFSRGWMRSICTSMEYSNFREEKNIDLPDQLAEEQPLFSGFVRYRKELVWEKPDKRAVLEISDAYEGVEVFVNGQSLGIQIAMPCLYDLTDKLKAGNNEICIEIATTLERETSTLPDQIRQYLGLGDKKPVCPSGINGRVTIWRQ